MIRRRGTRLVLGRAVSRKIRAFSLFEFGPKRLCQHGAGPTGRKGRHMLVLRGMDSNLKSRRGSLERTSPAGGNKWKQALGETYLPSYVPNYRFRHAF